MARNPVYQRPGTRITRGATMSMLAIPAGLSFCLGYSMVKEKKSTAIAG